ncbi:MAG: nucleotidyltransferase domain-containing protein [Euryarchaeota archaeon]|nr:nucleotidyltransferase domain-containing protein [Euryarchaeota archaeon]
MIDNQLSWDDASERRISSGASKPLYSERSIDEAAMKDIGPALRRFKKGVRRIYGKRLRQVLLFGSWARKEAREDSDVDVAVVLSGPVRPGREIDRMIDLVTRVNLEHGVLMAVYPLSESDFRTLQSPLLMNIRKEGVAA